MLKLTTKLKQELNDAGLLAQFLICVGGLVASGLNKEEAENEALKKFEPRLIDCRNDGGFSAMYLRKSSVAETIQWVARNMTNLEASCDDCPDPTAWTLLQTCREEPSFKIDFLKSIWTKLIPSRGLLDDDSDKKEIDGAPLIEMIDKILVISNAAKEGE